MPLYLCQSGTGTPAPWCHNLSVYATPSALTEDDEQRPLRRLRHGEVVLVDDVCVAWDRYWLRLRWPGHRGGFAGYIPVEKSDGSKSNDKETEQIQGERFSERQIGKLRIPLF